MNLAKALPDVEGYLAFSKYAKNRPQGDIPWMG
jgi:hypothetical protein